MNFQLGIVGSLFVTSSVGTANASNILGMFLTHSPSHVVVHMAIVRALVDRGHNVTVITSLPLNDRSPGYRHIFLKSLQLTEEELDRMIESVKSSRPIMTIANSFFLVKDLIDTYSHYVRDPDFISFIMENNHFDLMLLGYAFNEFQLGLAAHLKSPTVLSWPIQPVGHVSRIIGNPTFPAIVPQAPFMDSKPMEFSGRVLSFIIDSAERLISGGFYFYLEWLYNQNYPPSEYPSLAEMRRNVSLIFVNHHFSEGPTRPLIPGLVEIGGIQIKNKPDPLPEDIKHFLDASSQGAILFSLGSYVRGDHLGPSTIRVIHNVLSSFPYNVLWKVGQKAPPGNASNIMFKSWFPQDDILAHSSLRLFITHGGKGSITESEYHGVPMVALPLIGDQPGNAEAMKTKGHGVVIDYRVITEESFREAVMEVMGNERYKNAVQSFSKLYRDRPLTARQSAVFWVEYVIRHRGAPHMQSQLKTLNILQENHVDVIVFVIFSIYVAVKLVKLFLKLVMGVTIYRKSVKQKMN